jgi:Nif-specific regulatory protein
VTLYDRSSETISIHRSFGLTDIESSRGVYSPGEGITGEVVESGAAIMVPNLGDDERFLDRTKAHGDGAGLNASFFCMLITHAKKVLGAISAERVYHNRQLMKQDMELVATLGAMIAPAVELYMLENIEKVRLENENRRLHNELKKKYKPENIIGNSKPMQDIYQLIDKVSSTKARPENSRAFLRLPPRPRSAPSPRPGAAQPPPRTDPANSNNRPASSRSDGPSSA